MALNALHFQHKNSKIQAESQGLIPVYEDSLKERYYEIKFENTADSIGRPELERLQNGGRLHEERKFADIIKEKPIKVTIRVLVPVKEHPKVPK
ncbi:hypothetical protein C0J52_20476 [Blattella germanica]|nr:hypothetical protein C0J52_20476 [Blattella germanica]